MLDEHLLVGEEQRVLGEVRVDLGHLLLDALDRRDELHPGGDLRRLHRVVDEVHPLRRRGAVLARPSA